MSDGSLFVDIIPNFSTLRKRAKGEKVEVGTSGAGGGDGGAGAGGAPVRVAKGGVMSGLMKLLGKIGIAMFVIQKLLEVFQPVIEVIGAIVKTLGLLLLPLVRLLLVLLTPVLKWLANFVSDFLTDPFGAVIRGIRDIFTQLIPELLSGLTNSIVSAMEALFPRFFKDDDAAVIRSQRTREAATGGFGIGSVFPFLGDLMNRVAPSTNLRREFTVNVEGITDEPTVAKIRRLERDSTDRYGRVSL